MTIAVDLGRKATKQTNQLSMKFQFLINVKMVKSKAFSCFETQIVVFILLIYVKMPTIVGILTFMSRIKFLLG